MWTQIESPCSPRGQVTFS